MFVLGPVQLCHPVDCSPPGSSEILPQDFPDKNTGAGCRFFLQGIFPTQELNPHLLCLLHWRKDSLHSEPPGKPLDDIFGLPWARAMFWFPKKPISEGLLWICLFIFKRNRNNKQKKCSNRNLNRINKPQFSIEDLALKSWSKKYSE